MLGRLQLSLCVRRLAISEELPMNWSVRRAGIRRHRTAPRWTGQFTASTRTGDCGPVRSDREGGIMMRAHRRVVESLRQPVRPRACRQPPPNVALLPTSAREHRGSRPSVASAD
jgi:hypothetical protein